MQTPFDSREEVAGRRRGPKARPDDGSCQLALAIAAAAFDVSPQEIRSRQRHEAETAAARHVAIYLAHIVFRAPMPLVGKVFGRDRTSVRYAVRRVEDRRDDPVFDRLMDRLERVAAFCGPVGEARP